MIVTFMIELISFEKTRSKNKVFIPLVILKSQIHFGKQKSLTFIRVIYDVVIGERNLPRL